MKILIEEEKLCGPGGGTERKVFLTGQSGTTGGKRVGWGLRSRLRRLGGWKAKQRRVLSDMLEDGRLDDYCPMMMDLCGGDGVERCEKKTERSGKETAEAHIKLDEPAIEIMASTAVPRCSPDVVFHLGH